MVIPPYLCYCRVLQWIMKWIMQMPHNIFILTKVEVHELVPGIYEYEKRRKNIDSNTLSFNGNELGSHYHAVGFVNSFVELLN